MRIYFTRRWHASPDGGRTTKTYLPGRTYNVPADIPLELAQAAIKTGSAKQGNHTDRLPPVAGPLDEPRGRKTPPSNKAHDAPSQNKSSRRVET